MERGPLGFPRPFGVGLLTKQRRSNRQQYPKLCQFFTEMIDALQSGDDERVAQLATNIEQQMNRIVGSPTGGGGSFFEDVPLPQTKHYLTPESSRYTGDPPSRMELVNAYKQALTTYCSG